MILIKLGSRSTTIAFGNPLLVQVDQLMLAGLLAFFGSFVLWIVILCKYDLSYISPLLVGVAQVLILAGAIMVVGERPSLMQLVGAAVVIVGVVLMNWRSAPR